MAGDMMHLIIKIMIAALAVLAVVAVLDYTLQRYRFMQRNRMSKQEVKDEIPPDRRRSRRQGAHPQSCAGTLAPPHDGRRCRRRRS